MICPIKGILHPWGAIAQQNIKSKKRVLQAASGTIADNYRNICADDLFESLLLRERLGSTAIGGMIAIPHARMPHCTHPVGILLQLQTAIDFDACDHQKVDLVFLLVAPEHSNAAHNNVLDSLIITFQDQSWCDTLRAAPDSATLYQRAINIPSNTKYNYRQEKI